MGQQLAFQLSLTGNFASALKPVNDELGKTETKLGKVGKEFELFETEMTKAKANVGGFGLNLSAIAKGGSLFTFDLAEGAMSVLEVFEKIGEVVKEVVEKVVELGIEMLKTAAKTQDLNLAVKLDVGEAGVGGIDKLTEGFEKTSRFGANDIKAAMLPLLEQGVTDTKTLDDLATAATDIAARRNGGMSEVQGALEAFQKIALKGEVDQRALRSLAIGEADFFKDLGGLLGVSSKQAEELTKAGKVKSKTLLSVALNQIAEREGGSLGQATMAAGDNLTGMWMRFARLPEQYFEKLAKSPALDKLSASIGHALEALDPESPVGQKIQRGLEDLMTGFGNLVEKLTSGDTLDVIVAEVNEFVDDVRVGVQMVEMFVGVMKDLYDITIKLASPMAKVLDFGDRITGGAPQQKDGLDQLVERLREGYENGTINDAGIKAAVDSMSDDVKERFKQKMGIHSPSRVFQEYGEQTAAGFALGLDGGAAMVNAAARRGLADAAFGSTGGASSLRGGGATYQINVPITIDGAGKADVNELADEFEKRAYVVFTKIMDDVADAGGAAAEAA